MKRPKVWNRCIPVLALIAALLAGMCGCSSGDSGSTVSKPGGTQGTGTDATTDPSTGAKVGNDVVEDMGGYEFIIATPTPLTHKEGASNETNPFTLDLPMKLFYQRIAEVEQEYNCKITFVERWNNMGNIAKFILAGDKVGDVLEVIPDMWIPLAGAGYLRPWNDVFDIIDETDARWLTTQTERCQLNGKTYVMAYERPDDGGAVVLWYNKDILREAGFEDPAELVKQDKWTWDVWRDMLRKTTDASQNKYGLVWTDFYADPARTLPLTNNATIVKRNDKGEYVEAYMDDAYIEAVEYFDKIVNVDKSMRVFEEMKKVSTFEKRPDTVLVCAEMAKDNLYAFMSGRLNCGPRFKEVEGFNYGMVVYPKGPKADDYYTHSRVLGGYCMTSTNADFQKSAKIFRAIARPAEGYEDVSLLEEDVLSAYFRDDDTLSREMLTLATKNGRMDIGDSIWALDIDVRGKVYETLYFGKTPITPNFAAHFGNYNPVIAQTFAKLPK